jgi:ribosomal protein S12 methylthiotransferase accessory factor
VQLLLEPLLPRAPFANARFTHYPRERWFQHRPPTDWPAELLTPELQAFYNPEGSIPAEALIDINSGNAERGICAIPYVRQRDGAEVFFPVNIIGNLYVSNGMSAGNTQAEARAQALSEILERHVKFRSSPRASACRTCRTTSSPATRHRRRHPGLRDAGFGILVKDASLGGNYPVMCVTCSTRDQGCFASFGAHPRFEIALERALTELLQGRALEALDGFPSPASTSTRSPARRTSRSTSSIRAASCTGTSSATRRLRVCDWNFSDGTTATTTPGWSSASTPTATTSTSPTSTHLGVYACRILVPGMSEIYPIDDLEWENNSVGNAIRPRPS